MNDPKFRMITRIILVLLLSVCIPSAAKADETPTLEFDPSGTFTVLALSGISDTQYPPVYASRAVAALLEAEQIDLVVLLGDQLDGSSAVLRLGSRHENTRRAIEAILNPIEAHNVPFAVLFGTKDHLAPVSVSRQADVYRESGQCVLAAENGVERIDVIGTSGDAMLSLYFFDTVATLGGKLGEAIESYGEQTAENRMAHGDNLVDAVAFTNAPLPEVYRLFARAEAGADGAVPGRGSEAGAHYRLSGGALFTGAVREAPNTTNAKGLFDAFLANDDVFLTVSGGDTDNTFIGTVGGIDMASVPSASYTAKVDPSARGARLFRFYESDPMSYDTMLVSFSEIDGRQTGLGALHYGLTTTGVLKNAVKLGTLIGIAFLLAVWIAVEFLKKPGKQTFDNGVAEDEIEEPEDAYL